jgi:predicted small metal-binding protein
MVSAETKEEVLQAAAAHAVDVHRMTELSDEVVKKVKALIVPTS